MKFKNFLRNDIKKNWKTRIAGCIIGSAGIASVFIPELKVDWWEALVPILIGVYLAAPKDGKDETNS